MDLYLSIDKPEGKRIRLWKDATRVKFESGTEGNTFYPNRPLKLSKEIAERYLMQDPNLLSTDIHPNYNTDESDDELTLDQMKPVLLELGQIKDFNELSGEKIREYGKLLDIKIPANIKKGEQVERLELRCIELSELSTD